MDTVDIMGMRIKRIDFHSHILPCMDDGSKSVEESLSMLRASADQGVSIVVATPHYYAHREPPDYFLRRRDLAFQKLEEKLETNMPDIILGAEVHYYEGIGQSESIDQLCIGRSNTLLIEMPFVRWPNRMIDQLINLAQNTDKTVLLAHIDRYLSVEPAEIWDVLYENGIKFQVNADTLSDHWIRRRRVMRYFRENKVDAIGSDCHNMTDRAPNLGKACQIIESKVGIKEIESLEQRARELLRERNI